MRVADGTVIFVQHSVRLHPAVGEDVCVRFTGAPVSVESVPERKTAAAAVR